MVLVGSDEMFFSLGKALDRRLAAFVTYRFLSLLFRGEENIGLCVHEFAFCKRRFSLRSQ